MNEKKGGHGKKSKKPRPPDAANGINSNATLMMIVKTVN